MRNKKKNTLRGMAHSPEVLELHFWLMVAGLENVTNGMLWRLLVHVGNSMGIIVDIPVLGLLLACNF